MILYFEPLVMILYFEPLIITLYMLNKTFSKK
eukprot:UN04114